MTEPSWLTDEKERENARQFYAARDRRINPTCATRWHVPFPDHRTAKDWF